MFQLATDIAAAIQNHTNHHRQYRTQVNAALGCQMITHFLLTTWEKQLTDCRLRAIIQGHRKTPVLQFLGTPQGSWAINTEDIILVGIFREQSLERRAWEHRLSLHSHRFGCCTGLDWLCQLPVGYLASSSKVKSNDNFEPLVSTTLALAISTMFAKSATTMLVKKHLPDLLSPLVKQLFT